jgi:hypothetical protein
MSKTASLTAGLVAKKGQAMPAAVSVAPALPAFSAEPVKPARSEAAAYYKALTVKLDRERYETLKNAGVKLDKKSQEIFVEALDAYLAKVA